MVRIHTRMFHDLFSVAIEAIFSDRTDFIYAGPWVEDFRPQQDGLKKSDETRVTDILVTDTLVDTDVEALTLVALKRQYPGLRVLFLLPTDANEPAIIQALRSRADGFVFQSATREVIVRSARTIADGQSYLQSEITPIVLEELRKARAPVYESEVSIELTEREHMLLQLSADGLSNQRISEVLYVHEKTVRNMWSLLFQKLGVNDRTQAVLWAIRSGHAELR